MNKKATLLSALLAFSVTGIAQAGTITKTGSVKALTDVSQILGLVGNANFDEGPTSGVVPVGTYTPSGLTWRTGTLASILPGCTNTGSATQPQYNNFPYFPLPIGGGGTHNGQCSMFAGVATFNVPITQVGLTASTNGTQYLTAFNSSGAIIGQVTWTPAGDSAFVGIDSLGVTIAMIAYGNHDLAAGQPYDIGGATIINDSWMWATGKCSSAAQCDDGNVCTTDTCNGNNFCVHTNNTVSCSDGNACTTGDVCAAGSCTSGAAVTCTAMDQCHSAGVCDSMTGVCSNPAHADGSVCSDGNACTQSDSCQAGVCTGASPVTCTASDGCHSAGTCNPVNGTCTNPAKADGSACSDANLCTQTDTCQSGVCTGMSPVVCAPIDSCHTAGTCDMTTGMCSTPSKADGSMCSDNNACTQTDTCTAGVCSGANPITCTAMDSCHDVGMCNVMTGVCTAPTKADGTACPGGGTCSAGACNVPDAGAGDAGVADAGAPDAAVVDSGTHDSGAADASMTADASSGADSGFTTDSGDGTSTTPDSSSGCGCEVQRSNNNGFAALGLGLLAMAVRRRRARATK